MWLLVHNIFEWPQAPIWESQKMAKIVPSQIGIYGHTKMLCTKIHIYNQFWAEWEPDQ